MGAKEFIMNVPVPACGLSLGLASLDRFLRYDHGDVYVFSIFALLSFIIASLFTIRIFIDSKGIIRDIQTPAVFGVLPTYTMTIMLLSAFVKDHSGGIAGDMAFMLWASALTASFVIMFFFIKTVLRSGFSMDKVFPSWVIIFVGYVVASVTSSSFGMEELGRMIFWAGFTGYLLVFPLIAYRTLVFRQYPGHLVPTIAIFAAPVNLCIVGCLTVYDDISGITWAALSLLTVMGAVSYAAVVAYLPVMLNRKFHPSFSSMTFPLVISAVSIHELGEFHGISSNAAFGIVQTASVLLAVLITVYVFVRYAYFFYGTARSVRD